MQCAAVTSTARGKQSRNVSGQKHRKKPANKNKETENMNEYLTYSKDLSCYPGSSDEVHSPLVEADPAGEE